jgi:bifunctional DNA-binding transcriptional regulator/antitoxin component of YhaV-PrlF toxin-antitoxin module
MAKMKKGQTKVVVAKIDSVSLRTTIPSHIVELMKLKDGDSLEWNFDIKDSEGIVTLKKVIK